MKVQEIQLKDYKQLKKAERIRTLIFGGSFFSLFFIFVIIGANILKKDALPFPLNLLILMLGAGMLAFILALLIYKILARLNVISDESSDELEEFKNVDNIINSQISKSIKNGFKIAEKITSEDTKDIILINDEAQEVILFQYPTNKFKVIMIYFNYHEIDDIKIEIEPSQINEKLKASWKYSVGGAMVGGIAGLITGALIDSLIEFIRGPKQIYFVLSIDFELKEGKHFVFKPINCDFSVVSDNIDKFNEFANDTAKRMDQYLNTISKYFKSKILV